MAARQINLSVSDSSVKPNAMNDSTEYQQLSQWLISVAETRNKDAFSKLFQFFAPKILRIAFTKFNQETQAQEVVQETMSNVWRKAHLFDDQKGAATTWVYTVMRNVTFDMLRKVQSNREDTLSDDIWPMTEHVAAEDEVFDDHLAQGYILSVIDQLPENQQQVIKGFYFLEMSQEQLANHLDLPLGTIKSRLRLALAKLKVQLGEKND